MFTDTELIGIPHQIILSDSGLDQNEAEYKGRRDSEKQMITLLDTVDFVKRLL